MKEIKYKGNLEEDIEFSKDKLAADKRIGLPIFRGLSLSCIAVCLVGLLLCEASPLIIILSTSILGFVFKKLDKIVVDKEKKDIKIANEKMMSLNKELEENGVMVSKINLLNKTEISKVERNSFYLGVEDCVETTVSTQLEEYWSFLDNNQKIQLLKRVRDAVIINGIEKGEIKEKYFLLEEDDKNTLSEPLKKVLKINK